MFSFIDAPLIWTALLFLGLSFLLALFVNALPVWCQTSWFIVAVIGITCVGTATGIIDPTAWPALRKMAFIFIAALPGMMYLDYLQKKSRVAYWEKCGPPKELQTRIFYLSELLDRLAFWWTRRRIANELEDNNLHKRDSDSDPERMVRYPNDTG